MTYFHIGPLKCQRDKTANGENTKSGLAKDIVLRKIRIRNKPATIIWYQLTANFQLNKLAHFLF